MRATTRWAGPGIAAMLEFVPGALDDQALFDRLDGYLVETVVDG